MLSSNNSYFGIGAYNLPSKNWIMNNQQVVYSLQQLEVVVTDETVHNDFQ